MEFSGPSQQLDKASPPLAKSGNNNLPQPVLSNPAPVPARSEPEATPNLPIPDLNQVSGKRKNPSASEGEEEKSDDEYDSENDEDEESGSKRIPGKMYGRWRKEEHERFLEGLFSAGN